MFDNFWSFWVIALVVLFQPKLRRALTRIGQGRILERAAVQIKGPRSTIERREVVGTAPVDVSGSRQTVARAVALALPESVYPTRERAVQRTVEIRAEEQMKRGGGR